MGCAIHVCPEGACSLQGPNEWAEDVELNPTHVLDNVQRKATKQLLEKICADFTIWIGQWHTYAKPKQTEMEERWQTPAMHAKQMAQIVPEETEIVKLGRRSAG